MQEFTTFDMIIVAVAVILGLKGLFRGFIKEVFGLVGIIGGIFVASRLSDQVGGYIKPIIGIESEATLSLIGFVLALIIFWLVIYIVGSLLSKATEMSGLGAVNRLLGFIFGTGKILLIISVIVYSLYQIQAFKTTLDEKFKNSITFPYLVQMGGYIVKLDTSKFTKSEKEEIEDKANETEKKMDSVAEKTDDKLNEVGKAISKTTETVVDSVKETTKEIINNTISSDNK